MSHVALRNLVTAGELSATLAAHGTLLADAGADRRNGECRR